MAQSVLLPDGSSVTIRSGETPDSAYARAQQMYPEAFGVEKAPEDQPKSGFMPALKAGASSLAGSGAALAGRLGIMGLPEAEKYIAEEEAYRKKTFAPTTKSFTEAPLTNIAELAGGSIPYMVAPVVAGVGAAALPVTGLAGTALGLGAAGLTSAGQFTGSNLSRQMDTGKKLGETDLGAAALAAIPQAALDTVSMRMIPGLGKMFERAGVNISAKAANDLAKEGIKKTAADYLFATGKTMGTEGLTEAGQQVFERMQAGLNLTDPAARAEYFDNFLGGAVLGSILAPAGRYVERGQEQGRFDKNQRDAQKQRSLEESQAKAEADAKLEAERQTPEYALNAQQVYQAAEQRQAELLAQLHKGSKENKLTEEQKQDNRATTLQLKEHAAVLSDAAKDYRRSKQFLPVAAPPAPEAITDTTALQNQMALIPGAEAPAPTAPELDLLGQPLARVAPEAAAVEPTDFRQQVRQLQQLVEQYNTQAQTATPAEIISLLPKYEVAQAALVEAQKNVGKSVEDQLAVATKKMEAAKILGDLPAAAKHAQKVIDLQAQIAPQAQQGIDMPAQERGYYGTSETSPQFGGRLSRAESEAYVDRRTQERGQERGEAAKQKEVSSLERMGEKRSPGSPEINEQLGLFGANDQEAGPTTPSSAPLGQMQQILTGEDVTATAPEEGKRQVQRGGEAPFKLYPRREGTEEPLTAEELRQRIDRLQLRDDLSSDAYAFLTRVSNRVPETDKDGILTLIDEQLARIERSEEGFVPKGAGKETLYDAFPVQTPPTSTVTPTLASGKDFGTRTGTEAKDLARARAKRYKEAIDSGKTPAQAAYQARSVTQEDIAGPFQGRPGEAKAPTGEVKVQKRVDDLAKVRKTGGPREQAATLRGPSATAIEMGMYPDALEQYLRVREDLDAAEQAGQMDLFGEKELAATALTRATPAMFQRYLNSAAVKEMRSREKEATQQVAALPEIKKVSQSISELEQKLSSIKNLWETTATAKSILAGNTKAKEAITAYGRLQNDPMFSSILSLSASSKSEEHAQLQESIKVYNNALDDIREQIATTEKFIGKSSKKAKTVDAGLKDNKVKLDILGQQQTKLQNTLNKLDSLKNNAEAAQAAKDHIDSMIAIMAARDTLAKLGSSAPTARDVIQVQSDLAVALNAKRRAEAASKAQDELRDTTDRSYATKQKAEEMSAARTRNWNWLHAGEVRRYRALTDEERAAFTSVTADEVQTELAYEQQLNGLKVPQLKMEIGKMDKERAALLKKIDSAKAKSESYLAQAMAEEAAGMNVAQVRAEESRLEMMANQIRGMHGAGGGGSAVREKVAEFRALKQKLDAFYESRKPGKKASLAMYGPKGSIFTKPAFKGVEGFLKQQADLATRIDAAETRLNELEARAKPIMQRRGEDVTREIKPATSEEQDLIGMAEDAVQQRRASEVKVNALVATMKKQKARGNTEGMAETAKELAAARAQLAENSKKTKGRTGPLSTTQSAEPSKLRSGSEESKKIPGVTKTKLSEAPIEKIPTAKQAVAVGNQLAAEKIAAGKKLTKKEVKSMDLAQKTALQAAAFDRLSTLNSQVSGMKQTIANLQQARSDYAAGRRKSFNLDVLKNAEARLAALEKETTKAREQAGVLEDVGEMTAAERNEDAIADMPLGQDLGEEGALYRTKTSEGAGMKEQEVARLADRITANWTTIPEIVVVATEKGLPLHIQKQAERDNMTGKIPGLYDTETKKVYLVAENLHTGEDVALTVAHEIAGHFGLREMLGGEYAVEMNRIYDGNKSVRTTADAKMKANALLSKETAVEEVLADIAETGPTAEQESALRRIYNIFKRMFARVTGAKYLSDEEVRQVVASARHYVQTGEGGRGGEVAVEKAVFRSADYKSDDALSKTAQRVVAQPKTLLQKVRGNSNVLLEAQMQGADMRAGLIKALENAVEDPRTMGSTKLFRQAIFSITAADQHMPITQMAATMGPPKMFKDEKGYYEVRSSMENSAIDVFDSVQDIPDRYGNAEAKMGMASMYMIAQRALNKGLAKLDTGAMGVTEQELQDVMRSVDADPELKAALEKTRKLYNAYNKGMIEWLASPQVAAISRDDAKAFLKDEDYVPYYRVLPNGNAELVFGGEKTITIGDIKHQPYLAELKGGDAKIMPLNQSVMRNTMLLVTKGMTNMAQKNIAYAMQAAGAGQGKDKTNLMPVHKGQGVADASIIRWTQEPDPSDPKDKGERWLRIQTNDTMFGGIPAELIIKSMEGAHLTLPAFLKLGGMAGDLLRSGVTRTPIYLARQLIRDPFAATATAGLDYGPLTAIFRANKEFLKMTRGQSETGAKLIEKGLVQSGIFDGSPADMEKMALQLAGGKSLSLLGKLFKGADSLAIKADAATRALIYDNAIKNGLSEVEASHAVRESMNFYKRGLSPTVQYASRMIPFFNAQIQGLSVLAKAARGNMPFDEQLNIKRKFINNAMMLTGVGIAYAMAMDDDEYYKNAKPKDRYSNFFLHLPGVDEPVKLPIPYEFGWFFSAGVAAADAIKGEVNTPQQLRALKDMFVGAIPGASNLGMPQIIKPIAEVYANKSFFSGNPLESERLRKLDPEARYNASTTEMAKWFASMVPGLSPIQIEHIVSGYLGQVPLMVAASADGLFAKDSSIEEPTRRISQLPLIGSSFQRKYGGEEADVVYKLAADALETKRTFDNYRSTGKIELAKEYLQDHRAEIMVAPMALQYQKVMGQIRKQEEIVRGSRLDADAKAKRIEELDKQRQLQSERYMKAIQRAEAT